VQRAARVPPETQAQLEIQERKAVPEQLGIREQQAARALPAIPAQKATRVQVEIDWRHRDCRTFALTAQSLILLACNAANTVDFSKATLGEAEPSGYEHGCC
jgi:hypothetical protein